MDAQVSNTTFLPERIRFQWTGWNRESYMGMALSRLIRRHAAVIGMVVLGVLLVGAVFAPIVAPYDPLEAEPQSAFSAPDLAHYFGTDYIGRDIFSQVLYGGRISLQVGFISVGIGAFFGVILGLLAGYHGRRLDSIIMRLMDVLLAFPGILLAMVIVAVLGTNLTNLMVAVGISLIPVYTRLVRATVLSEKENLYVEAARVVGCPDARIMLKHILPNVIAPVIVLSTQGLGRAIIASASLSFLGLGAQPPTPEWGMLASGGRNYLRNAWWISTFPGLAILVAVIAINLVGDGLRDALDPRLKN